MIFCSFQPYDWKTSVKKKGFMEIYEKELGFNPMYCMLAENAKNTYIQMINICPVTPEKLLFFKTNNVFFVDKVEHYQALSAKQGKLPEILSFSELKKWLISQGTFNMKDFISSFPVCCEFEYLVNKDDVSIIGEIDIKDRVSSWLQKDAEMIQKMIHETQEKYYNRRTQKKGYEYMSDQRAIRDGTAKLPYARHELCLQPTMGQ